ncbi:suppressor of fused domain protein [Saccharopolyspora cebuensis]|uniref:Suppressor of fused domain protein n=1 Tax=Saccharopolyspora cebuensis TaxID=418759 RepID=A0ABV4CGG0_9PSEU
MSRDIGLLGHLQAHLGAVEQIQSAESVAGNRGFDLVFFNMPDPGISTVVTNGLRLQKITSMMPEELVCSLWEGQRHIAQYLAESLATMLVQTGQGLDYGMVVESEEPLIEDSPIQAVLAHPSPFFGDKFSLYPDSQEPEVQLVSLIPITSAEAAFAQEQSKEALFAKFEENRVKILDVNRPSAA